MIPFKKTLLFIIAFLLSIEILLRFLDINPNIAQIKIDSKPSYFVRFDDPYLGFSNKPGNFKVCINNGLYFEATVNNDGNRVTNYFEDTLLTKPSIGLFGCSFTYGHGLNDYETMAWQLNERFKTKTIMNFGIGATGTTHSFLQIQRLIKENKLPKICVLNYAYFQNMRNSNNRLWRMMMTKVSNSIKIGYNKNLHIPYFDIENDSLRLKYKKFENQYKPFPLSNQLSIMLVLDVLYSVFQEKMFTKSDDLTLKILQQLNTLCKKNNSQLVIFNLDSSIDETFKQTLKSQEDLFFYDIGLNLDDERYNFLPYDNHPNQLANNIWADSIYTILNQKHL